MNKDDLIKAISDANMAYTAGIPFMSDYEYDLLWQQLHFVDPTNDLLYHTAQQRNNLTGATFHKNPIFGTNKAFNMTDLGPYLTRCGNHKLVFEPKYDGCAVVLTKIQTGWQLTYEGDGFKGADITHKLPHLKMPTNLMHFQSMEVIIPWEDWQEDFGSNPRNTVAGWLARKHDTPPIQMTAIQHNYGPLRYEYTYNGDLDQMAETLLSLYNEWNKIYPLDGIMIKVLEEEKRLIIGNNGQTNNWSIAWKPPIQTKETIVHHIEWNVSRLGRVIPTVIYEPVELCSTVNNRATGNNAKWLYDKLITKRSIITLGKAGEIIPKILEVDNTKLNMTPEQEAAFHDEYELYGLSFCPVCGNDLSWEGVHLVCNSPACIAQLIKTIHNFYSKKGIKIDGLAEKTIEKILSQPECYNILKDKPWALLDMKAYGIDAITKALIGDKIFNKLQDNIDNMNNTVHMAHFISGLGLPGLAYKTALRLCQFLKTGKLTINISEKARTSFLDSVTLFNQASDEMTNFFFASIPSVAKAIFCITGTLSMSREAMITIMENNNYEFGNNITKETDYLIVGSESGKTKRDKAAKYGLPEITEDQFFRLIENQDKEGVTS